MHREKTTSIESGKAVNPKAIQISRVKKPQIYSKIDLDYAYGRMNHIEGTNQRGSFAKTTKNERILKS